MGRIDPSPENVLRGFDNAPKFGRLKKGDTARILLFEFGPTASGGPLGSWAEWVHSLRVPAVKETRPDGAEIEIQEEVYIGSYICLGDEAELAEKLYAPATCPFCARADQDESFRPTRRHATNIIRYGIKPNGFELNEPYSVELLVWTFSERQFKVITQLLKDWNDLRQHDLQITCTNGQYQNYEIHVAPHAAWLAEPYQHTRFGMTLQQLVVETVKSQKIDDEGLQKALGNKIGQAQVIEKLQTYDREMATRGRATVGATSAAQPAPAMSAQDLNDMLAGNQGSAAPQTTDAPAAAPVPVPETQPVTTQSVDDLLS